ncbi:uncharacterized protein MONOS_13586 [Monocercomonoides exilis]|uniref:uncharacterized protein n=1 Tax=Monocercomonoides exilis TaxID=2049356 RepID=UPI00355957C3|nr:hypothetical protein MONOS_13586 [Monocercomonoides exilis]|eukprot:MONOS_13586.1-p1 / transcript=MONOS_13586.1 / gene=MONOS_13586 / organism=Monocercomonoides_exilis_PA203 / gene_product=unspecified product / transcript_product=unspecified product / location=Mono_scaffold00850:4841-5597(+) / protein_length=203 / sequence_SO=supercontig / SO=protein_coding / is_pseudo=false
MSQNLNCFDDMLKDKKLDDVCAEIIKLLRIADTVERGEAPQPEEPKTKEEFENESDDLEEDSLGILLAEKDMNDPDFQAANIFDSVTRSPSLSSSCSSSFLTSSSRLSDSFSDTNESSDVAIESEDDEVELLFASKVFDIISPHSTDKEDEMCLNISSCITSDWSNRMERRKVSITPYIRIFVFLLFHHRAAKQAVNEFSRG